MGDHFMFDDDREPPNVLTVSYELNDGGGGGNTARSAIRAGPTVAR